MTVTVYMTVGRRAWTICVVRACQARVTTSATEQRFDIVWVHGRLPRWATMRCISTRFRELFVAIDSGRVSALVTPITVAEVVTGPLKAGKEALAERYRRALTDHPSWSVRSLDVDVTVLAARMRLRYKLKLRDALQLAVAVREGCHALVTHDRDFSAVKELPVLGI